MKKFILSILPFFVLLLFPCIKVSAASFALSAETLTQISDGFSSLEYLGFSTFGISPYSSTSTKGQALTAMINQYSGKNSSTGITNNDLTSVIPFSDLDYDLQAVLTEWEVVDYDGNYFDILDSNYCTFDNGYYSGSCLVDDDGNILLKVVTGESSTGTERIVNIAHGGSTVSKGEWSEIYSGLTDFINTHQLTYNYDNPSLSSDSSSFFLSFGNTVGGRPSSAESLFIANQYQPGVVVPVAIGNGAIINSWYANTLSVFNYTCLLGNLSFNYQTGTFTKGGQTYHYKVNFGGGRNFQGATVSSFQGWLNGSGVYPPVFGMTGYNYDSSLAGDDTYDFMSSIAAEDDYVIGNDYGLDDSEDAVVDLGNSTARKGNPHYDPTKVRNRDNDVTTNDTDLTGDLGKAIPDVGDGENDDPIELPEDIPIVLPDGIPDLPIVGGLQNHFPFSIPWDIKNLLKSMRAIKSAPNFHISWYIQPLNYTWIFDLDLSMFNAQAEIFRTCFLISFIIGLALFSYKHFFGQ